MTENQALWLNAKGAPLTTGAAPYTAPRANEIVVRVRAVAVNPMDRLQQTMGDIFTPWIPYPFVLGSDVAGEVVETGVGVTRFHTGDRVAGFAAGSDKSRNRAAEGAFQDYVVLLAHMASPIPDAMPFEDAAVLPLGLSTAACGLFQKDFLAMNAPSAVPARTGKVLLVWGGSTSVGSNAIQLATAAGYDVITTASPRNFAYVKGLGASEVFDYRSKTVRADIAGALRGRELAGALAIGAGSAAACIDILGACAGHRFVAMATPPTSFDDVPAGRGRLWRLAPAIARMITGSIGLTIKARRAGVRTKMIWGSTLIANEVGPMIFEAFLPAALADGRYVAAPSPAVAGTGLAQIPAALERQRRGVSASKLVGDAMTAPDAQPVQSLVSVTRFRLRSIRFLPFFILHANRTIAQIRKAEGFVAGSVQRDASLAFWTMTVWRDEKAMRAYGASGAHRKAVPHLAGWGSEASAGALVAAWL